MATHSLEVMMKEPLGLCTKNQIILSSTSLLLGSLEEVKASLAWIVIVPILMLHWERVLKGFMAFLKYQGYLQIIIYLHFFSFN